MVGKAGAERHVAGRRRSTPATRCRRLSYSPSFELVKSNLRGYPQILPANCSVARLLRPIKFDLSPRDREVFVRVHLRVELPQASSIIVLKLDPDTRIPVVMTDFILNRNLHV